MRAPRRPPLPDLVRPARQPPSSLPLRFRSADCVLLQTLHVWLELATKRNE